MEELLTPCMKHGGEADLGAQVPGIGRDLLEGLRRRLEEDGVDDLLVLEGDLGDLLGEGEDDVEVLHRQEICLPGLQPVGTGHGLALGTVPITARVVGNLFVTALVATLDVTAECCGSTGCQTTENSLLGRRDTITPDLEKGLAVSADDVGHLQVWP